MLTNEGWNILNKRWILFFFSLAILNELVWRTQTEEFWVNFKVWGLLPITFIFTGFQIGLINKCFSAENFIESTMDYVKMLSETSSPRSISVMKAQVYKAFFQDLNNAAKIGDEEMQKSFSSEDFKEGVSHFVEKRAPKFSGK